MSRSPSRKHASPVAPRSRPHSPRPWLRRVGPEIRRTPDPPDRTACTACPPEPPPTSSNGAGTAPGTSAPEGAAQRHGRRVRTAHRPSTLSIVGTVDRQQRRMLWVLGQPPGAVDWLEVSMPSPKAGPSQVCKFSTNPIIHLPTLFHRAWPAARLSTPSSLLQFVTQQRAHVTGTAMNAEAADRRPGPLDSSAQSDAQATGTGTEAGRAVYGIGCLLETDLFHRL